MDSVNTGDAQLLYESTLNFTEITDYGISFQDLLTGKVSLPPGGVRFDVAYAGSLEGSRLSGTISGTDYFYMRADGRLQMHVHGRIITHDGANISYFAESAGAMKGETLNIQQSVTLFSMHPDYIWVNDLSVWSTVLTNPAKGEIRVKTYAV